MPVVINEFEVMSEPPPAAAGQSDAPRPPAESIPPWTVHDVTEIAARARIRAARTRAD